MKNLIKKLIPTELKELFFLFAQYNDNKRNQQIIDSKNKIKIDSLLDDPSPILLELGAEKNREMEGWTYVDLNGDCDLTLNLTKPIPFPNDSIDTIYSSHLLEHFEYPSLLNLLKECYRVIKPGGTFSVVVPNAGIYIRSYSNLDNFNVEYYCKYRPALNYNSKIDYVNYIAYMAGHHKYMFDEQNIITILEKTGFQKVALRNFDPTLDLPQRDYESIYVVAKKSKLVC
jgi:predicted SAM-dependent methyltransferase